MSTKYSDSAIEEIKNRITISDVASSYSTIVKRGKDNWCCCPIHGEKTPSMILHDDSGTYHCFGCNNSGSMFKLIQQMEHISFSEALKMLAKRTGVELKEESEEEKEHSKQKQAKFELYDRLCKTFSWILDKHPQASEARAYIEKRSISRQTANKFCLGYAPSDIYWLWDFLKDKGYSDEFLASSGIFTQKNNKVSYFSNRVIFPIRNWKGECVAFSGRDLSGQSRAKYINSPETEYFKKRCILYGFYESLPALRETGEIILCEGNFDAISLHQAGVTNAVATCGTAFTSEHCKLIKRYCTKVSLLFDSDEAGQKATRDALILCQQNGLDNWVIRPLTGAKDASQMLEEQGTDAIKSSVKNICGGFVYLVHLALKMYDTRQFKTNTSVFKEVKPYIEATQSPIERQGYIKYLSDILKVPEQDIIREYNVNKDSIANNEQPVSTKKTKYNIMRVSADLNAMLLIVNYRNKFEDFRKEIRINMLSDPDAVKLYAAFEDSGRGEVRTDENFLQMIADDDLRDLVENAIGNKLFLPDDPDKSIARAIAQIKIDFLENKRKNLLNLINTGVADSEEIAEFLSRKTALDREIQELHNNCDTEENL